MDDRGRMHLGAHDVERRLSLSRSSVRTVPIGVVGELIRGDAFYWGQLMAGALLGSVPVALIYSFFVKYYVAGLTAGAVKG